MIQECIICGKIEADKRWFGVKNYDGKKIYGDMQRAHEECILNAQEEGILEHQGSIFNGEH
jgi:hypothetical protein